MAEFAVLVGVFSHSYDLLCIPVVLTTIAHFELFRAIHRLQHLHITLPLQAEESWLPYSEESTS